MYGLVVLESVTLPLPYPKLSINLLFASERIFLAMTDIILIKLIIDFLIKIFYFILYINEAK